jgi:hypothetical protein
VQQLPKPPLPDQVRELLAKPNPSVITTVRPDGQPVSVATWYLWEDGRFLSTWMKDASASSTCAVVEMRDDAELADADRLARRYLGMAYPKRESSGADQRPVPADVNRTRMNANITCA